jgi:hypothetical protein
VATPIPVAGLAGRAVPWRRRVVQPRIWRLYDARGLLRLGGYLWSGGGVGSHGGGLRRGGGMMAAFWLAVGDCWCGVVAPEASGRRRRPAGGAGRRACRGSAASSAVGAGPPRVLGSGQHCCGSDGWWSGWLRLFWWPCRPLRARVGRPLCTCGGWRRNGGGAKGWPEFLAVQHLLNHSETLRCICCNMLE